MADKQQIAQAAKEYLSQIPQAQASVRLPDLAQVLTDKLGEHVSVSELQDLESEFKRHGVELVQIGEPLPVAQLASRKGSKPSKMKSDWTNDLAQRVQAKKGKGGVTHSD